MAFRPLKSIPFLKPALAAGLYPCAAQIYAARSAAAPEKLTIVCFSCKSTSSAMVITSVAWIWLVAGVLGVPLGVALQRYVVPLMGHAAGTTIPAVDLAVYHLPQLLLLGVGGLAIATAGAVLPAGWAARTGTAKALRTE